MTDAGLGWNMFGASPLSPSPETSNDGNPLDKESRGIGIASRSNPSVFSGLQNYWYERNLPNRSIRILLIDQFGLEWTLLAPAFPTKRLRRDLTHRGLPLLIVPIDTPVQSVSFLTLPSFSMISLLFKSGVICFPSFPVNGIGYWTIHPQIISCKSIFPALNSFHFYPIPSSFAFRFSVY